MHQAKNSGKNMTKYGGKKLRIEHIAMYVNDLEAARRNFFFLRSIWMVTLMMGTITGLRTSAPIL